MGHLQCHPLITIGASTTALYDTVVHVQRRGEDELFSRFFHPFRREIKTATFVTLLWMALIALLYLVFRLVHDGKAEAAQVQTLSSTYFAFTSARRKKG